VESKKIGVFMRQIKKAVFFLAILIVLFGCTSTRKAEVSSASESFRNEYTLDKVVVLSRHNMRSPLSDGSSVLSQVTPHQWFNWTSRASELSLKGGVLETIMGQYFRKWLESEAFLPENYIPKEIAQKSMVMDDDIARVLAALEK